MLNPQALEATDGQIKFNLSLSKFISTLHLQSLSPDKRLLMLT